jgi:superfamily II DNA helicase RecQ
MTQTQHDSVLAKGTRHKQNPRQELPRSSARLTQQQWDDIQKEVDRLPDLVKTNFTSWKDGARPFQLTCMAAQALGQDVLLHAATGTGKTGIAAGPHLLPSSVGKVTLVVSPLLSLHEEQVMFQLNIVHVY